MEREAFGRAGEDAGVPICVDLDRGLVRTDVVMETLLQALSRRPSLLLRLPLWLVRGQRYFKERLAEKAGIEAERLPYGPELLGHLWKQRAAGRRLVLVTSFHESIARTVADHLGLFDRVLFTDGSPDARRRILVERFGEGGFDYAGRASAGSGVWTAARRAIPLRVSLEAASPPQSGAIEPLDPPSRTLPAALVASLRLQQWVKNLLVCLPLLLAHRYMDPVATGRTLLAFLALGMAASAVYVLNDLLDVEADRHHPTKSRRPFASGDLPLRAAFVLVPALAAASALLSASLGLPFLLLVLFYFSLTTAYSLHLKQVVLVDILVLAALYTLRILAGAAATSIPVSEWLLAFSVFLFFSLAAVKRYGELLRLRGEGAAEVKGRGYLPADDDLIVQMGLSSGYLSVLVLALYVQSDAVTVLYHRPVVLWLICPLQLYWISRIWLLVHRGQIRDDPLNFAVRDRTTWLLGAAAGVIVLAAKGVLGF